MIIYMHLLFHIYIVFYCTTIYINTYNKDLSYICYHKDVMVIFILFYTIFFIYHIALKRKKKKYHLRHHKNKRLTK